ncbi:unnamed protein product [Sphagnum balticum]
MRSLVGELKSGDWKAQFEGTNKLRRLVEFHPEVLLSSAGTGLHSLVNDLLSLVDNLRSSVAKNSLICLQEFIILLGRQLDPEVDLILDRLVRRAADTNFRGATHFMDVVVRQISESNSRVSAAALAALEEMLGPLRGLVEGSIAGVCQAVWAALSSGKVEIR